jgi:type I restriction enzyme S subunit
MGQSPPSSSYNEEGEGLPFFQGKADFGDRHPTVRVWCTQPTKIAEPGDVLITVRAPVGPTNVADRQCAIGRGLAAFTPLGGIATEFLLFGLRLQEPELALSGTGSTFTAINKNDIENIAINVPPLQEQLRIIKKIEELLAHLNGARDHLSRVPAILKRFRQAVLAAACSGRLTENWRTQNALEVRGVVGTTTCDANENLPELPEGWRWQELGQTAKVERGRFSVRPRNDPAYYD